MRRRRRRYYDRSRGCTDCFGRAIGALCLLGTIMLLCTLASMCGGMR